MKTDKSKIRVAVSDPKLQDKVRVEIKGAGSLETIYWFIRFNIPLDPASVNEGSMEVTDTDGYVMRTDISYRKNANRIAISPLDSYEDRRYYLLKVSKNVRSEKGQSLKTAISILFKLYQGEISDYKILKKDVPVPPSRPRPNNYEFLQETRTPNFLDSYTENLPNRTKMQLENAGTNPVILILGAIAAFIGLITSSAPVTIAAIVACAFGITHIYVQWQNKNFRAKIHYNKGVKYFNKMQYQDAKAAFEKALRADPGNELAKYGLVRVGIYK